MVIRNWWGEPVRSSFLIPGREDIQRSIREHIDANVIPDKKSPEILILEGF